MRIFSVDNCLEHPRKNLKLVTFSDRLLGNMPKSFRVGSLLIILMNALTGNAQHQPTVDSLLKVLEHTENVELKVSTYLDIAYEYQYSDSANTFKYANEAIRLAQEAGLQRKVIEANDQKAWVTMIQGNYRAAHKMYLKIIEQAKAINYRKGEARAYSGLGIIFREQGNYSGALEYLFKSLAINQSLNDTSAIGSDFHNIATIYSTQGEFKKSLDYLQKSLKLKNQEGDLRKIANTYNNIGVVYWRMQDLDMALENYQRSMDLQLEINDLTGLTGSYINIGEVYMHQNKLEESLNYLQSALELSVEIGDKVSMIYAQVGLGQTYSRMGRLEQSKRQLEAAISLAKEIGYPSIIRDASLELAEVEKRKGNYKAAYEAFTMHKSFFDSLNDDSTARRIARLEAENEFRQERDSVAFAYERERVRYVAELKYSRIKQTATYVGSGLLLVIAIVLFLFYRSKQKANQQLAILNDEIFHQNEEITEKNDALQQANDHLLLLNETKSRFFSIISHDIRRPMNLMLGFYSVIKSHLESEYGAKNDQRLQEMSLHLNTAANEMLTLLDNLLSWALKEEGAMPYNPEYINIKETLEESLTAFQLQAELKSINLSTDIPKSVIGWVDIDSFNTIIRNLVGNSLKFTPEHGSITVGAYKNNGKVKVTVADTGVGIAKDKLVDLYEINESKVSQGTKGEKGSGLGLNIVHDFVKLNRGYIEVDSVVDEYTTFTMYFPSSEPM